MGSNKNKGCDMMQAGCIPLKRIRKSNSGWKRKTSVNNLATSNREFLLGFLKESTMSTIFLAVAMTILRTWKLLMKYMSISPVICAW